MYTVVGVFFLGLEIEATVQCLLLPFKLNDEIIEAAAGHFLGSLKSRWAEQEVACCFNLKLMLCNNILFNLKQMWLVG